MRRCTAVLVLATALLLSASDALSMTPDSAQTKDARLGTIPNAGPTKRFLRTVSPPDEIEDDNAEERGVLGEKTLMQLSKLTEKWEMQALSKKLELKAWLKASKNPQTLFKEYGFKGKSLQELKMDPNYLHLRRYEELWIQAQYKKNVLLKPDAWKKLMEEQAKKAAA